MTGHPTEEQLTAYVLGELGDAARAAVERALAGSPELRAEADARRRVAAGLTAELAKETRAQAAGLGAARRQALLDQLEPLPRPRGHGQAARRAWGWRFGASALAAAAAAALIVYPVLKRRGLLETRAEKRVAATSERPAAGRDRASVQMPPAAAHAKPQLAKKSVAGAPSARAGLGQASPPPVGMAADRAWPSNHGSDSLAFNHPADAAAGAGAGASKAAGGVGLASDLSAPKLGQGAKTAAGRTNAAPAFAPEPKAAVAASLAAAPALAPQPANQAMAADVVTPGATATYPDIRRMIRGGHLPKPSQVHAASLINFFSYTYPVPPPTADAAALAEVVPAPWSSAHRLVRIAIRARGAVRIDVIAGPGATALRVLGASPPHVLPAGGRATFLFEVTPGGDGALLTLRLKGARGPEERSIDQAAVPVDSAAADTRFAVAVAEFALLLGPSPPAGASWAQTAALAGGARGADPGGRRADFVKQVKRAAALAGASP